MLRLFCGQIVTMTCKAEEGLFKRVRRGSRLQRGGGIERDKATLFENGDPVSDEFDFGEGMGSKKQRSRPTLEYLRLEEMAERGGGDGVETPARLIKEKHARRVHQGTGEA